MLSESEQAQGRRLITTINCVGCIPGQFFLGSVLLLFLTSLAMNRVGIMVCLSIPAFVVAVFQIPFAHWADRVGKKKLGHAGMVLALGGMLMAGAIRLGMFRNDWSFVGTVRSDYDALLLICGTLVMVVAMTLGLVPSVTGRAQGPSCD